MHVLFCVIKNLQNARRNDKKFLKIVPFFRAFICKKISRLISVPNQLFYIPLRRYLMRLPTGRMWRLTLILSNKWRQTVEYLLRDIALVRRRGLRNQSPYSTTFKALFAQRQAAIFCSAYSHSTLISHFLNPHRLPLHQNICAYF